MTSTETDWLTERFDEFRPRMRSVAFRMLGSWDEADEAVQEAWVRVARSGAVRKHERRDGLLAGVVLSDDLSGIRVRIDVNPGVGNFAVVEESLRLNAVVAPQGAINGNDGVAL